MRPLEPISEGRKVVLGLAFFVLFFAAWAFATLGGFVSKTFLADPITMVKDGWLLLTKFGFARISASRSGAWSAASCWRRLSRCRWAS